MGHPIIAIFTGKMIIRVIQVTGERSIMFNLFRIRLCTSMGAFAFAFAAVAVSTPPAHAESPCGDTYTVQRGDTLARIAR